MEKQIVVGGGISGSLVAMLLKERGISLIGLEKADRLGGRVEIGHHRVYEQRTIEFLSRVLNVNFSKIEETPRERRKKDWGAVGDGFSPAEMFYLKSPFYYPERSFAQLMGELKREVGESFELRKKVVSVIERDRVVQCEDGSKYLYEKLIWCGPLERLNKARIGENSTHIRFPRKTEYAPGGINIDLNLCEEIFPFRNTMVMRFRFKETVFRALGLVSPYANTPSNQQVHWMLLFHKDILEDKEEVAKIVRALKRELHKEFPELERSLVSERITYMPSVSGEEPVTAKTLEIAPNILYVGPQIDSQGKLEISNLDLVCQNCFLI